MADIDVINVGGTDYNIKDTTARTAASNAQTAANGKAPTSHAVDAATYGLGTASLYGHVKLSDTFKSSVGAAANSIGASQAALYNAVYNMSSKTYSITGGGSVEVYKVGRMCTIIVWWNSGTKTNNTALCTLDAEYRPITDCEIICDDFNNPSKVSILSGVVTFKCGSSGVSFGRFIRTYVTAS